MESPVKCTSAQEGLTTTAMGSNSDNSSNGTNMTGPLQTLNSSLKRIRLNETENEPLASKPDALENEWVNHIDKLQYFRSFSSSQQTNIDFVHPIRAQLTLLIWTITTLKIPRPLVQRRLERRSGQFLLSFPLTIGIAQALKSFCGSTLY